MRPIVEISTDMPAGNAVVLEMRFNGSVPEVHFTPSPAGGPEALWFCFEAKASSDPPPPEMRCVMHFADCLLGGGADKPFFPVFSTGQQDWTRVERVEWSASPDGRPLVSWPVPGDAGPVRVAFCYPYGLEELEALAKDLAPAFRSSPVGVTQAGRLLHRLDNGSGAVGAKRPGVYCLARQHAAETAGSWMLDGFLRRMAAAGDSAPLVWAVPLVNLDGVCAGHYGKDSFPWDFNRAWGSKRFPKDQQDAMGTHPMRYEARCIQADMLRWRERCAQALVLDFHSPGMGEASGIYAFLRDVDEAGSPDAVHRPWVDAVNEALGQDFAAERFVRSGRYPSRWNTARIGDFAIHALRAAQMTFEVPYGRTPGLILTREAYREAGSRVAEAAMRRMGLADEAAS